MLIIINIKQKKTLNFRCQNNAFAVCALRNIKLIRQESNEIDSFEIDSTNLGNCLPHLFSKFLHCGARFRVVRFRSRVAPTYLELLLTRHSVHARNFPEAIDCSFDEPGTLFE